MQILTHTTFHQEHYMKPVYVWLASIFLVFSLSGCNTLTVTSKQDEAFDFSQVVSFSIVETPPGSINQPLDQAVMNAISTSLTSGGLKQAGPDKADILVAYQFTTEERTTDVTVYRGWRDYSLRAPQWDQSVGTARTTQRTYTVGSLVIGVFDGKSKELKWQSVGSREQNPSRLRNPDQQRVNDAVNQILADLPVR